MSQTLAKSIEEYLEKKLEEFGSEAQHAASCIDYQEIVNLVHQSKEFLQINESDLYSLILDARIGGLESGRFESFAKRYAKLKEDNPQFHSIYQRADS